MDIKNENRKSEKTKSNIMNTLEKNDQIYDMLKNPPELSKRNLKNAKRWVVNLSKLMLS